MLLFIDKRYLLTSSTKLCEQMLPYIFFIELPFIKVTYLK